MTTKKHLFSATTVSVFALLFWASATQKPIERIHSTNKTYEQADRNTTPAPYEVTYELPVLKAVEQTKQDQVKGGVTVSCEVTPFEAVKTMYEEKEIATADPNKPGYDIYKVGTKARYEVKPGDVWFNIRIKNNQDRILKLKDVAIVMLVDGVAYNIPDEAKQDWVGGMLVKGFEKTQRIRGPKISGLATDKIVYVSINDVPTAYNAAGEVTKKENFEWYYQVAREKVTKQEMTEYAYQEVPVYKERCSKCNGGGKEPHQIQCDKCYGTKQGKCVDYSTGKTWICTCDRCNGTGIMTLQSTCGGCSGKGAIEYPKSPTPKALSEITWTGWKVTLITEPEGSAVSVVDPETGKYKYVGVTNGFVNWFSSNSSSSETFPIILEYQGKKYKIMPYDTKGKPSGVVNVNFLGKGGVTVKGGKIVN